MKIGKSITALLLSAVLLLSLAACSQGKIKIDINRPDSISTVEDDPEEPMTTAIEASENVNGRRFSITLYQFPTATTTTKSL